jgi:hypothetical protein
MASLKQLTGLKYSLFSNKVQIFIIHKRKIYSTVVAKLLIREMFKQKAGSESPV